MTDQEKTQADKPANSSNRWRFRPIFRSLKMRVRFVVLVTVLAVTATAGYGFWRLNGSYHDEANRANERYMAAVTHEAESLLQNIRKSLVWTASELADGSSAEDCRRALESFSFEGDSSVVMGVALSDGSLLCSTGNVERKSLSSALNRAKSVRGLAVGDVVDSGTGSFLAIADAGSGKNSIPFAVIPSDALNSELFAPENYVVGITDMRGQLIASLSSIENLPLLPPARLLEEMVSRKEGTTIVVGQDGRRITYSFRAVESFDSGQIYFFLGVPTNITTSMADRATWETVALMLGMLMIVLWIGSVLGGFVITRRVRRIASSAKQIISGELDPGGMAGGISELSGITGLFTQMAQKLKTANETMEQKVKSRTSMLNLSKGITELQKARTEALLASIGEGVIATDTAGRISFLNDQAKKSLFWKADKYEDVPIFEAFRLESAKEETVPKEEWPIWPAIKRGETVITSAPARPFYMRRKDNSTFPVKMIVSPILLNNEVVGALIVFGDITSEVEFDQRKSEFISVASHQLRSPSSAVKFMADMMRKGDLGEMTEKQLDWIEKLYQASDAMLNMVNELLNISRVEAGVKMDPQEHEVGPFIAEITGAMTPLLLEKKQEFELMFDAAALPKIIFDKFSIGEVLKNLISNASKYSPEGAKVTIKIEVSDHVAFFSIRDRGMGIPKSSHDQMFNKFFRAENALNSTVTGTGLGLYYCKSVVEKHGGKIGFESKEGKGSVFWFTLPTDSSPLLENPNEK